MQRLTMVGLVSGAVGALLALGFYLYPEAFDAFDATFFSLLAPLQTPEFTPVFELITYLGGGVGIITAAVLLIFALKLPIFQTMRLALLLGGVTFMNRLLKGWFERERPEPLAWLEPVSSFAFPSAHASSTMALYGFIALLLYRRTGHWLALALPALVILLVGLSRIVLNVHHFTDVVGGYLLGLALLALVFALPLKRYG